MGGEGAQDRHNKDCDTFGLGKQVVCQNVLGTGDSFGLINAKGLVTSLVVLFLFRYRANDSCYR